MDNLIDKREIGVSEHVPITENVMISAPFFGIQNREARIREVARLYFVLRKDPREIAKDLNYGKSQIYSYICEYRKRYLTCIKDDIKVNRIILEHMVALLAQSDSRIQLIWEMFYDLENAITILQQQICNTHDLNLKKEIANSVFDIYDRQRELLAHLSRENIIQLQIYDKFGLCSEETVKTVLKVTRTEKSEQFVKNAMATITDIIAEGIEDPEIRMRIFGKLANEIDRDGLRITKKDN